MPRINCRLSILAATSLVILLSACGGSESGPSAPVKAELVAASLRGEPDKGNAYGVSSGQAPSTFRQSLTQSAAGGADDLPGSVVISDESVADTESSDEASRNGQSVQSAETAGGPIAVHRLRATAFDRAYRFEVDAAQRSSLIATGRWVDEGPAFYVYSQHHEGLSPAWLFEHRSSGATAYAANNAARSALTGRAQYQAKGVAWYARTEAEAEWTPLHVLRNVQGGSDVYTISDSERASVLSRWPSTYVDDGEALFVRLQQSSTKVHDLSIDVSGLTPGATVALKLSVENPHAQSLETTWSVAFNGEQVRPGAVQTGGRYSLTVESQPASAHALTCLVTDGSDVAYEQLAQAKVECATRQFAVSGTVTGLPQGAFVQLALSPGIQTVVSENGTFSWPGTFASGTNAAVSVVQQPAGALCRVRHGDAVLHADLTTLSVICRTGWMADTGSMGCYKAGSNALQSCTDAAAVALNPSQDGMLGLDVDEPADVDGARGFSYTKISNSGQTLPVTASIGDGPNDWACTRDNVTGLMWEAGSWDGFTRTAESPIVTFYDDTSKEQKYDWWDFDAMLPKDTYSKPSQDEVDTTLNAIGYANEMRSRSLCGFSDWRMPSVNELQGLVHYGTENSSELLDSRFFTPPFDVSWTREPVVNVHSDLVPFYQRKDAMAWAVMMNWGGSIWPSARSNSEVLRLVRGGSPSSPRMSFTASGSEVVDAETGLTWKRCLEGMSWSGGKCTGTPTVFTHGAALAYARSKPGWRVPNVKELSSILDRRYAVGYDPAVFPNTPTYGKSWTSTPTTHYASGFAPGYAPWIVKFKWGVVDFDADGRHSSMLRLVKDTNQ